MSVMSRTIAFAIAIGCTYGLSFLIYIAAALAYAGGLRPMIYGYVIELLTGILAIVVTNRLRASAPSLLVLLGVAIGRSLRGFGEFEVLVSVGGFTSRNALSLEALRVALVLAGALAATLYLHWKRSRHGISSAA
jgi:hypothetical protein